MSFLNQSGDLAHFTEVVPGSAAFSAPERSSILTARRRAKISPQTGPSVGSAGAGAGGQQVQFLLADQGGFVDMRSMVVNYTVLTSGGAILDDGHPFMTVQVLLNGQLLENIQSAPKVANAEMCWGGSKSYYQSAGSLQGWELLNADLQTSTSAPGAWGQVSGTVADILARQTRAAAAQYNNIAGEQRSIPLGLMCGLGRMKSYLPISLIGELGIIFQTGQAGEVLFNSSSAATGDYSISNLSIEYDVVVPDQRYFSHLQKMAMEEAGGLVLPYESAICTTGGVVSASPSALTETSVIVSRATNNLLRVAVVQVPASAVSSINYPSQSCFSKSGVYSAQWRVGSLVFPMISSQGDASLFNMSLASMGSVVQENGSITNRCLWANSTAPVAGTPTVYETAKAYYGTTTSTTDVKFCWADRFVPSYGFQTCKGDIEAPAVDGISLAGASGSQIITTLVSAPAVSMTPFVILTALKFIKAHGGAVSVVGA